MEKMSIFLNDMKSKGFQPTLESFFKTSARLHNIPGQLEESRKWRTLTDLLSNPWFERLWVVQEVVMAPDEMSRTGSLEDPIIYHLRTVLSTLRRLLRSFRQSRMTICIRSWLTIPKEEIKRTSSGNIRQYVFP